MGGTNLFYTLNSLCVKIYIVIFLLHKSKHQTNKKYYSSTVHVVRCTQWSNFYYLRHFDLPHHEVSVANRKYHYNNITQNLLKKKSLHMLSSVSGRSTCSLEVKSEVYLLQCLKAGSPTSFQGLSWPDVSAVTSINY